MPTPLETAWNTFQRRVRKREDQEYLANLHARYWRRKPRWLYNLVHFVVAYNYWSRM